ncbi:MAG: hypothetical protein K8T26_03385 [Lentisphaerae bacterium]|nr:hypothetical protein [Lentisphaerota bacterium]
MSPDVAAGSTPWRAYLVLAIAILGMSVLRAPEGLSNSFGAQWVCGYNATNWVLSWDEGFVHRGLLGTILAHVFGKTGLRALFIINLTLTMAYVAIVASGVIKLYRRSPGESMLWLLLCAIAQPSLLHWWFTYTMFARIDLCIVIGTIISLRVAFMRNETCMFALLTSIAVVCMFIHEGFGVLFLPLILGTVLVVRATRGITRDWKPWVAYLLPSLLTWFVIGLCGRPKISRPAFEAMLAYRSADFHVDEDFVTALFIEHGQRISIMLGKLLRADTLIRIGGTLLVLLPTLLLMRYLWRATREQMQPDRSQVVALGWLQAAACAPLCAFFLGFDFMRWLGYFIQTQILALAVLAFARNAVMLAFLDVVTQRKHLVVAIVLLSLSAGVTGVMTSYPVIETLLDLWRRFGAGS